MLTTPSSRGQVHLPHLLEVRLLVWRVAVVFTTILMAATGVSAQAAPAARLLFTAQMQTQTLDGFFQMWYNGYNVPSTRINVTAFVPPPEVTSGGQPSGYSAITFFVSGEGRLCDASYAGREMHEQQHREEPKGSPSLVLEMRHMGPESTFSIPSSWDIPASWLPTTTTTTTTTAATATPTPPSTTTTSPMSSSWSMPSSSSDPSGSASTTDPCIPVGPDDLSLSSWNDIQDMLTQKAPQELYSMLNITEMWTNITSPSGVATSYNASWEYRLVVDANPGVLFPRVGRVEVRAGGGGTMWGSICAKNPVSAEVALRLCNAMYPGTTSAKPYYARGGRGFIALADVWVATTLGNGTVVATINGTISSPVTKRNSCTHKFDLGLVCGSNVTYEPSGSAAPVLFAYNYTPTTSSSSVQQALDTITMHSIAATSIAVSDGTPNDGLTTSLYLSGGQSQRDEEWILEDSNPWSLASVGVRDLFGDMQIQPRDLGLPPTTTTTAAATATSTSTTATTTSTPHISSSTTTTTSAPSTTSTSAPSTFKVTFGVNSTTTSSELQTALAPIVNQSSIATVKCEATTTTSATNSAAAGAGVRVCVVEFYSQMAAQKAVEAGTGGSISFVYSAALEGDSSGDDSGGGFEGDDSIVGVAVVIVAVAAIGSAVAAVVIYRRRRIPHGEAFSLDDHFEQNEMIVLPMDQDEYEAPPAAKTVASI